MIDALPNVESVYAKWEDKNPYIQNGRLPKTSESLTSAACDATIAKGREAWQSRFSDMPPPPRHRAGRRPQGNRKTRETTLPDFHLNNTLGSSFKTSPSYHPVSGRRRPFAGVCCDCMPDSKNYLLTDSIKSSGVVDVLRVNTRSRDNDWVIRTFCHISFVMQRKLGHKYPDLSMAVLTSPRLLEAIHATVKEEAAGADASKISSIQRKHEAKARSVLARMSASLSNRLIRFTGWFLHKLLGRLLSSIVIHKGQMTLLQQFCKKEVPVIFLPTHRSHLDYILLTFVLFNYDIKAPYVAAGDNLLIPFFGSLMRGLGGFFIRRKLDKCSTRRDHVYRAVLSSYMEELLRNNEYIEFFVEGGRTRSGKPIYPKGGLLSVITDAYVNGVMPEAYIVPVSISYDKLVDGNFVKEQMGEPKVYETFWRAVHAIYKVLMGQYGIVRMDFAQPFSLKEYLQSAKSYPAVTAASVSEKTGVSSDSNGQLQQSSSVTATNCILKLSPSDGFIDHQGREMRQTVQCLAEHVIYGQTSMQTVTSVQLLSLVLLTVHREGADLETIKATFEYLHSEILLRDHDVSFTGDVGVVLDHAQALLGNRLVQKITEKSTTGAGESVRLVPATTLPDVFELSYYANVLSPLFALESVLANSIYSILDFEEWTNLSSASRPVVARLKLMEEATTLCSILKYEFIFCPPCQTIEQALGTAFDKLRNSSIIITDEAAAKEAGVDVQEQLWAKRFAKNLHSEDHESDSEEEHYADIDKEVFTVSQDPDLQRKFWFFKRILSPLLETYYVASCYLIKLLEHDYPENDFVKSVHSILKERVTTGTATFAESAAIDTLKNAIRGFENAGVIHFYQEANLTMCCLTEKYRSEESVFGFIRRLQSYQE